MLTSTLILFLRIGFVKQLMKHSKSEQISISALKWVWPILIIGPMIIGFSWGMHFEEDVYILLRYAKNLGSGLGLTYNPIVNTPSPTLSSLVFPLPLSIPALWGINLVPVAGIISLLGWSVASAAFLTIGSTLNRLRGTAIAAILLIFNPWIITTMGGPASWITALSWICITLIMRRRYLFTVVMLSLLLFLLIPWPASIPGLNLSKYGSPLLWSLLLFSAAVGADWLGEFLAKKELIRLTQKQTTTILLAATLILFGSVQALRLWQLYQYQPLTKWQMETNIVAWFQSETLPSATILASEKIGYLAHRQVLTLQQLEYMDGSNSLSKLLDKLHPDYLLTDQRIPWQNEIMSTQFQLAFQPLTQFTSPYMPEAPYTVWAHRSPLTDLEPREVVNARVPDRLRILGYQIGPGTAHPGEPIEVALYLKSENATNVSPSSFTAVLRLVSPVDGSTLTEWEVALPQYGQHTQWQPGHVINEQFSLPLPDDLDFGAYNIDLSLLGPESPEFWPISLDNDLNRLDRIPLGSIVIPWSGELGRIQPHEANFGGEVHLLGYTTANDQPRSGLNVILYWQEEQAMDEDYIVFVHVLDKSGNLIASHDSQPVNGRFPTSTWREGLIVPDIHTIDFPTELPNDEYQIMVGLYVPETGERLPIINDDGTSSNNALLLEQLSMP